MVDVVFQYNPRVSNDVAWLSRNPSFLPASNNVCSWYSASLILFLLIDLLVDLVPCPILDLADGVYQSGCFLSRLSIDEIIGCPPLTCILSTPFNINRRAVVICGITQLPAVAVVFLIIQSSLHRVWMSTLQDQNRLSHVLTLLS